MSGFKNIMLHAFSIYSNFAGLKIIVKPFLQILKCTRLPLVNKSSSSSAAEHHSCCLWQTIKQEYKVQLALEGCSRPPAREVFGFRLFLETTLAFI